jgi:hypothetical protein
LPCRAGLQANRSLTDMPYRRAGRSLAAHTATGIRTSELDHLQRARCAREPGGQLPR